MVILEIIIIIFTIHLGAQTINEPPSQQMEIDLGDKIRMKATLDTASTQCIWEMPFALTNGGSRNVRLTMGKTEIDQPLTPDQRLGN